MANTFGKDHEQVKFMVDAFNREVEGLDDVEIWIHTCWGNPNMQRVMEDTSYAASIEIYLERCKGDVWTLEMKDRDQRTSSCSSRSRHDLKKKICIGAVSHRSLQADRPEDVAAEIRKALKYIPPETLIVSSDCGFGRQGCNREIAFYKASAIARAATSCDASWACRRRGAGGGCAAADRRRAGTGCEVTPSAVRRVAPFRRAGGLLLAGCCLAVPAVGRAQDAALDRQVAELLPRFDAPEWPDRERAFRALLALSRADDGSTWPIRVKMPDLVRQLPARAEQMTTAVIRLLERENVGYRSMPRITEDRSEYQVTLISAVASLRDARAVQALVDNMDTGNIASQGIAALGRAAVDAVAARLREGPQSMRSSAARTLAQMLDPAITAPAALDVDARARIKAALLGATRDEYLWVRVNAIDGLARIPGEDITTELQRLAAADLFVRPGAAGKPPQCFVRERAAAALAARK